MSSPIPGFNLNGERHSLPVKEATNHGYLPPLPSFAGQLLATHDSDDGVLHKAVRYNLKLVGTAGTPPPGLSLIVDSDRAT